MVCVFTSETPSTSSRRGGIPHGGFFSPEANGRWYRQPWVRCEVQFADERDAVADLGRCRYDQWMKWMVDGSKEDVHHPRTFSFQRWPGGWGSDRRGGWDGKHIPESPDCVAHTNSPSCGRETSMCIRISIGFSFTPIGEETPQRTRWVPIPIAGEVGRKEDLPSKVRVRTGSLPFSTEG